MIGRVTSCVKGTCFR